jgi:hypothetical protein
VVGTEGDGEGIWCLTPLCARLETLSPICHLRRLKPIKLLGRGFHLSLVRYNLFQSHTTLELRVSGFGLPVSNLGLGITCSTVDPTTA